jgi:hypothetical protein
VIATTREEDRANDDGASRVAVKICAGALPALLFACATSGGPAADEDPGKVLPGGGRARRLFKTDGTRIGSLAGDGARLYFTQLHQAGVPDAIWTIPKRGGPATKLLDREPIESAPVFDGGFAYFLGTGGAVNRARLDDGLVEVLAAVWAIDAAASPARPRDRRYRPRHAWSHLSDLLPPLMAVDGESVYWFDGATDAVLKVSKTGGHPTVLAEGLLGPRCRLVESGAHIYICRDGSLVRVAKAGPRPEEILPARPGGSSSFVVTAGRVLWAKSERLFELSATGAPATLTFLGVPSRPAELEVLGDTIFYAVHEGTHGYVTSQSLRTGELRSLSRGHSAPGALVADREAVYFVELGSRERVKDEEARDHCCSIWRAPR